MVGFENVGNPIKDGQPDGHESASNERNYIWFTSDQDVHVGTIFQ